MDTFIGIDIGLLVVIIVFLFIINHKVNKMTAEWQAFIDTIDARIAAAGQAIATELKGLADQLAATTTPTEVLAALDSPIKALEALEIQTPTPLPPVTP